MLAEKELEIQDLTEIKKRLSRKELKIMLKEAAKITRAPLARLAQRAFSSLIIILL
ncbi:hypothetical protein TDIS_1727 [Thermosulfurimonas dismutans]|uniref:Uncharacterized protein n=1 Tax=Thermosulfurimonas dismutans TaxID=999894 RepID=A0A179D2D8_9BACT|nr:hypothetical protein TDIS_1727 [Thermosulfurimonas dismutans]